MFLRQSREVFLRDSQVKKAFKTAVVDRWTILQWPLKREPLGNVNTSRELNSPRSVGGFSCFW